MFLLKEDLLPQMRSERLDQIIEGNDAILETAIAEAISMVNDLLFQHYDTTAIFSATGNNRNLSVLNWCKHVTLYILYERIPSEAVPERIIKNYNDVMKWLEKLNRGIGTAQLPRRQEPDGSKSTKFRWGSNPKRRGIG